MKIEKKNKKIKTKLRIFLYFSLKFKVYNIKTHRKN